MIENIELRAFILENIALARTLVIKNEDLAILDNAKMYAHLGLKAGTDKAKWRYYLNLNGEYHVTDEVMTVRSLDDNENIAFTKSNLEKYPATKKAYRLGSYYFSRLVAKYPHQMELIQGIINPIAPDESINAPNYTILRYTKDYVNWNESQLIPQLQEHIDGIVYQSFSTEYKFTDDLMLPFLVAHLHNSVVQFLLENRFENRFTRHAHPFYIWSYLQSRGISPIYKDLLNEKQTMWLFRNIDWVLRNLGKDATFKSLIAILLSERNIPLAKYDLIQSTEFLTENLHTEPLFYSERLNLIATKGLGQTTHSIALTMNKEIPEALDNELYYDKYLGTTVYESTYGEITHYPTKILNSELVDTTNSKPETFFNVLNNELIYLAGKNLYTINLDIEDPVTGSHQRIGVKDAIVLWYYLMNRYNGHDDCDKIPTFFYKDVMKIKPPTAAQMAKVGAKPFLNDAWCQDALVLCIPQIKMVSPSVFYENALNIFNTKWKHTKMYSRWLSIGYYSRRKNAVSMLYETGFMKLTTKKTYTEFLKQYDFNFEDYEKENYFALMWEIWKKMTGWDQFSHITLSQIQDGMISLMRFLSSYTVQYIHQTKVEEGWYEVGLDLFTENPSLLSHTDDTGQPELENGVESDTIPIHHRIVAMDNDLSQDIYIDSRFDFGTTEKETDTTIPVYETPQLYDVEFSDDDVDNGFYSNQMIHESYKLRLYTGTIPNDIDNLIPVPISEGNTHVLKEMIVKQFKGASKAGNWSVTDCRLVNNQLDNQNIATDVDGFSYQRIEKMTLGEESNLYTIGFVPSETGQSVVKIELTVVNSVSNVTLPLRFDYEIQTENHPWTINFEIPSTVELNAPFAITQTITGLSLSDKTDITDSYTIPKAIQPYFSLDTQNGLKGNFIKEGWPDSLPLLYTVLAHEKSPSDELLSRHYYFMRGFIPSDRYYDPTTDPAFIPTAMFKEADLNAITLERFTVQASSRAWTATDLYVKKVNGKYPSDKIKVDYAGVENFLIDDLNQANYTDSVVNGVRMRTFDWAYAIAKAGVTIDLVLELTSTDGRTVLREFQYKPTVVNHGISANFSILPSADYLFGIRYTTDTSLTVSGVGSGFTLRRGIAHEIIPNQKGDINITFDATKGLSANKVRGYQVTPSPFWQDGVQQTMVQDMSWAVQVEGTVKAKNGKTLTLRPYGTFTIPKANVVDYDRLDVSELAIKGWNQNTIYAHAIIPSRFSAKALSAGWEIQSIAVETTNGNYPSFIGNRLYTITNGIAVDNINPVVKVGTMTDGPQSVPSGYYYWFTLYVLGNRNTLTTESVNYTIPLVLTAKNKYSGLTKTAKISVSNAFNGSVFEGSVDQDELFCNEKNHITPSWKNIPLLQFGNTAKQLSTEGLFFGQDMYNGNTGYKDPTVCVWNSDNTADITLPPPTISNGQGIRIYNKRVYRSQLSAYADTSLQDVTYYPFVDYANGKINKIPVPKLEDFDFTPLGNTTFYQGIRSSHVTLVNATKVYEYKWYVNDVKLAIVGTEKQDDYIITKVDGTDYSSHLLKGGFQTNSVHDAPAGKTKYSAAYVSFVPAKVGKQTFEVVVKISNNTSGVDARTYRYTFDADVKAHEGVAIYDASYADPWWLLGAETFVLTDITQMSGTITRRALVSAGIGSQYSGKIAVRSAINSAFSSANALIVTVNEKFTNQTPQATVIHSVFLSGYYTTDPRSVRYHVGQLPIRADRLYQLEEVNLDTVAFKPDVTFSTMNVNEVYTERFAYNLLTRGWSVNSVRLMADKSWMAHYFDYDDTTVTNAQLFSNTTDNQSADMKVSAPSGQAFYLPKYGSRVVGKQPIEIQLKLTNKHHTVTTLTLDYKDSRNVVKSDIGIALTYKVINIGGKVDFGGGFVNVPSKDIHSEVKAYSSTIQAVGPNSSYFTLTQQPYAIATKDSYPFGGGNGIKIAMTTSYIAANAGKTIESATWYRVYRGEQVIPESDFAIDPANFDIKPMGVYFREKQSVAETLFFKKAWKEWTVERIQFAEGREGEFVLSEYQGIDLTTAIWYSIGETIYSVNTDTGYTRIRFMPKKAGQFTYPLELVVSKGKQTVSIPFTLAMEVKAALAKTPYLTLTDANRKTINETNRLLLGKQISGAMYPTDTDDDNKVYASNNGPFDIPDYKDSVITITRGVVNNIGGWNATIKALSELEEDHIHYNYYSAQYSLTRYGSVYNPTTSKQLDISSLMETTIGEGWIYDVNPFSYSLIGIRYDDKTGETNFEYLLRRDKGNGPENTTQTIVFDEGKTELIINGNKHTDDVYTATALSSGRTVIRLVLNVKDEPALSGSYTWSFTTQGKATDRTDGLTRLMKLSGSGTKK